MKLCSRFPGRQEIVPVLSLILFVVYSWTIFRMIYQVPSWLMSHTKYGLFSLSVYVFAFALLESLLLTGFILLICLVFPRPYFKEHFVSQGSFIVLTCTAWAVAAQFLREGIRTSSLTEIILFILVFLLSIMVVTILSKWLLVKLPRLDEVIVSLVERTTIFAWIYVPIGLFSTVVVFIRNIL